MSFVFVKSLYIAEKSYPVNTKLYFFMIPPRSIERTKTSQKKNFTLSSGKNHNRKNKEKEDNKSQNKLTDNSFAKARNTPFQVAFVLFSYCSL